MREAPVPEGQRRKKFDGVMFDQGEYQVNIQWVERDDDGDEFCLDFHDVAEEEPGCPECNAAPLGTGRN